jgi:hypothetical protein
MRNVSSDDPEKDILREYDFRGGRRGRYAASYAARSNLVALDSDVAAAFPDSARVNAALRALLVNRHWTSDTLVRTLRKEYGPDFLPGFRATATLGFVLERTGAASLSELLKASRHRTTS